MTDIGKQRMEKMFQSIDNEKQTSAKLTNASFAYKSSPDDVIICGPHKTGTTWLQNILHQIRTKGDENFQNVTDVTWFLDSANACDRDFNAEQICNPRIYKCHLEFGKLPMVEGAKLIFIIRDPYDTVYSLKKFFLRMYGGDNDMDDETCIALLENSSNTESGFSYFKILSSWWTHRNDPNVFWLFYEDLKENLSKITHKLSEFIGVPLNESELDHVTRLCSFEHMSNNGKQFLPGNAVNLYNMKTASNETWTPASIVRQDGGQIGQGRSKVSPKLAAVIERQWEKTMKEQFGFENYQELCSSFSRRN